jgi:hypothetical protein
MENSTNSKNQFGNQPQEQNIKELEFQENPKSAQMIMSTQKRIPIGIFSLLCCRTEGPGNGTEGPGYRIALLFRRNGDKNFNLIDVVAFATANENLHDLYLL